MAKPSELFFRMALIVSTLGPTTTFAFTNKNPFALPSGLSSETIQEQFGLEDLSETEKSALDEGVAQFNKEPNVMLADNSDRIYKKYFCVGGKLSIIVFGMQGFKCINTAGDKIFIGMGERIAPSSTGLAIDGFVGFNAGGTLLVGAAVIACAPGNCNMEATYYRDDGHLRNNGEGWTLDGAIGWIGFLIGNYHVGDIELSLFGYQVGFSAQFAASQVFIKRESNDR